MSRNEIYDVLTLEGNETVLRPRRGAIEALLTSHPKNGKPGARRHHREADDRHERRRATAHANMRDARY
jgi:hypothetical protein